MKRTIPILVLLGGCAFTQSQQEYTLHTFTKKVLSEQFLAEGSNFGDFNRDGVIDIVAGPYWYEGPDFTQKHEYYPVREFDPEHYSDNFFAHAYDFNGDGWSDILIVGFPGEDASWYENPGEEGGHWQRHKVFDIVNNESPAWADLTGDGRPELVFIYDGYYGYAGPDPNDATQPWVFHPISSKGPWERFTHGLGIGDVNGDGRNDILEKDGWWEQPESLDGDPVWTHHPANFGEGGSQMYAYDVDGDGDNDVITSLKAHGYGLAWYEQVQEDEFVQHIIMTDRPENNRYGLSFSQLHAIDLVDMDGDGVKDIVTGKRHWAHGSSGDSDADTPSVIYWFRTVRSGDGQTVDFVPYLIDGESGVGVQLIVGDLNGDELPDLVSSNKQGTIILLHERQTVSREAWEAAQPKPRTASSQVANETTE